MYKKQVGGCYADVDLPHAPAVKIPWLKPGGPTFDSSLFLSTAAMTGIYRNQNYSSRSQQRQRLVEGADRRLRPGYDRTVSAGKITEVKEHHLHRFRNILRQCFMTGLQQRHPPGQPCFAQPAGGLRDGLRLNIETPYMTVCTDQLSQQQGVMTVAAGRVYDMISVSHKSAQKQVRKGNRPAQGRSGEKGGIIHGGQGYQNSA